MEQTRRFELIVRCVEDGEEYPLGFCEAEDPEQAIDNLADLLEELAHQLRDQSPFKDQDHGRR